MHTAYGSTISLIRTRFAARILPHPSFPYLHLQKRWYHAATVHSPKLRRLGRLGRIYRAIPSACVYSCFHKLSESFWLHIYCHISRAYCSTKHAIIRHRSRDSFTQRHALFLIEVQLNKHASLDNRARVNIRPESIQH